MESTLHIAADLHHKEEKVVNTIHPVSFNNKSTIVRFNLLQEVGQENGETFKRLLR